MKRLPLALLLFLVTAPLSADDLRAQFAHLTKQAWDFQRDGRTDDAREAFREALAITREMGDRELEASTINWIGLMYQFVGDHEAAIQSYRRALAIVNELHAPKTRGEILYHLGWIHFVRRDFASALRWYAESLAARREAADRRGEAVTLLHIGMSHAALGRYEEALRYETEALPMARALSDDYLEADALDHIGVVLTTLHRLDEAIENHTRSLAIRRANGFRSSETFSLNGLAEALRALGRTREAAATMGEIVEHVEQMRRNLSARRFRGSMFSAVRGHYTKRIELLVQLGEHADAFTASEQARARLTLDAVQESLARAEAASGGMLFAREESLREEIERRSRLEDAGKPQDLESLRAELATIEERIRAIHPKLAAARAGDPLPARTIQSDLLDPGTAILEYHLGPRKSFAFVVTHDGVTAAELPPGDEIERAAVRLHQLLAKGDQRASRHEVDVALRKMSAMLVEPLHIAAQRLIIVPDGALFYVPFAALTIDRRALVDRFEISMAPSASALVLLRRVADARPPAEAGVAVFADPVFHARDPRVHGRAAARSDPDLIRAAAETGVPELKRLPATRDEANAIVALVRGTNRKALDFDASRDAVLHEDLSRYRVVHFATHALVNARTPELSGIVLSLVDRDGRPRNGFLRVHDLYSFSGAADLVVLSACRTAVGKELRGEGIVGLVSGFHNAGTPHVVASFWDVKDRATSDLMQRFYRGMFAQGLTPAAALRAAQRSMRQEERWQSPYYWAAFALFGL